MYVNCVANGRLWLMAVCATLCGLGCGSSTAPASGQPTIRFSVDTLRLLEGEPQSIPFSVELRP